MSESESEQKYENKYNMSDIRSYPIRFHPYGHWIELKTVRGLRAIDFNNVEMLGIIF